MISVVIFTDPLSLRKYALINGSTHNFYLLADVDADDLELFGNDAHAKSYVEAMIDRGLWNDIGIYRHSWTLTEEGGDTVSRTFSTRRFIDDLKAKNSVLLPPDDEIVTDNFDVYGFLNIDNYEVKHVDIVPRDFDFTFF